jgi:hypothetical protein
LNGVDDQSLKSQEARKQDHCQTEGNTLAFLGISTYIAVMTKKSTREWFRSSGRPEADEAFGHHGTSHARRVTGKGCG